MTDIAVYDFHAEWCGPCEKQDPIVQELETDFGDTIHFEYVDIEQRPDVANEYVVRSVPTVIITVNGDVVQRYTGLTDYETLRAAIEGQL